MKKGVLIALEGIEGCGKSTQAKMLGDALINKGKDVVLTHEPGATKIGSSIRNVLLSVDNKNINNYTELYLYLADRAQHLSEIIVPYYRARKIIISDRFYLSTVVYQGYGRGIDLNLIKQLHSLLPCFIMPDLTFIFDISLEESFRRTAQRIADNHQEQWSRFEKEKRSFHMKIREGFLHVQQNDPEHIKLIDGSKPINEIGDELITHMQQLSI